MEDQEVLKQLDDRQNKIMAALMSSFSVSQAAEKLKVSQNTVWVALKDPLFNRAYKILQRQAVEHAAASLSGLTSTAVARVSKILRDDTQKASDHLKAAEIVLNHSAKWYEVFNLMGRVEELEKLLEKSKEWEPDESSIED